MSKPFEMKGSSTLGYGNQHSKGRGASSGAPKMYDSPAPMMDAIAGIAGMSKKDEKPSGTPYASPAKQANSKPSTNESSKNAKGTKPKGKMSATMTKNLKTKTKKEELNQFGENAEQYKTRMKEMGLQTNKNNN